MQAVVPHEQIESVELLDIHEVWRKYEAKPKFFERLDIAEDGGFSELHCLFDPDRFFWAFVHMACLFMNLFLVIGLNIWNLSHIPMAEWFAALNTDSEDAHQKWLIMNSCIGLVLGGKRIHSDVLLIFLEFLMVSYYLVKAIINVANMCTKTGSCRWRSVAALFWDVIPELSVVSAMKSLNYVTPSALTRDITLEVMQVFDDEGNSRVDTLKLIRFLLGRSLHFLVGFEAFMIKFHNTAVAVTSASGSLTALLASLAFLNQVLGVINIQKFTHRRLFLFIFGGEDSFLSDREERIAATWLGMLAQRMWRAAGAKKPRLAWFLSLALTYSDREFQKLVLNVEALRKQQQKKADDYDASVDTGMLADSLAVASRLP